MDRFEPAVPLVEALKKHFNCERWKGGFLDSDNMPHMVKCEWKQNRPEQGRIQLAKAIGEMKPKLGVEIGVRNGDSALLWTEYNPDLVLWCIDPYAGRWSGRHHRMAAKRLNPKKHLLEVMTSMEALVDFEDNILDFVHIDGAHEFDDVVMDIICWGRKLKPGGIMACHDYCEGYKRGVAPAVRAYTRCHNIRPWFVTKDLSPTAFWQKP